MADHIIKRRKVFYIPGYDPIHPRRYRELYRSEGADQAAISGYDLTLSPGGSAGRYGWNVDAVIDGVDVHTEFEVLVWSDIVRGSMETGIVGTYVQLVRTAWTYIASGALLRLMRLRIGPVIAALYPIVFLIVQLILAVLAALLVWWGIGVVAQIISPGVLSNVIGGVMGAFVAVMILRWFKAKDAKFFVYYLMHDYAYSAASKGANPPELEKRMAVFSDAIQASLDQNFDEVLVVGHSSGAHLAVSILADLHRGGERARGWATGVFIVGAGGPDGIFSS